MTFQDISESLVSTAKEEGLTVTYSYGNPDPAVRPTVTVRKGFRSMGLVVSGNYDLSFYFKHSQHGPALNIVRETDLDKALSCGLDFIYG